MQLKKWQPLEGVAKAGKALIRKKEYQGPKTKIFSSKSQAQLWANAVEVSLKRPAQLDQPPPQILKEAIDAYIDGPLKDHRSGHNEQYPLKAMASNWMGGVPLSELSIRYFALWRDEQLLLIGQQINCLVNLNSWNN